MIKRRIFWCYAILTALILLLVRNNLANIAPEKMYVINFGLVKTPAKLALVNANLIIFDFASIILARSETTTIEQFLQIRKVGFFKRWIAFKETFLEYLVPVIIVHLVSFSSSNLIISWEMLVIFSLIWLILVGLTMYRLPTYLRAVITLFSLIIIRILV